jgi:hypothetical protein
MTARVIESGIHEGLSLIMHESKQTPNDYIFVIIETIEPYQPTGNLLILHLEDEKAVKEVLDGKPEGGLFVVFKNGKQIDDSDRFADRKFFH